MANVFGGGSSSSGSCGNGQEIIRAPRQQVIPARSVAPRANVFNETSQRRGELNLRDFYTRREVDKYLDVKVDISDVYTKDSVYTKAEVNTLIANLNASSFATSSYVDAELASQLSSINTNLAQNYNTKSVSYTKVEVDNLISAISVTGDYISKTPASVDEVTIIPGVNNLTASLIIRSSNNLGSTEVQRWENSSTDYLGSVYADGRANFVNTVIVGKNVNADGIGLELSEKRISNVANPVNDFDAVNKHFMEQFITTTIDQATQETDENYLIDALEY